MKSYKLTKKYYRDWLMNQLCCEEGSFYPMGINGVSYQRVVEALWDTPYIFAENIRFEDNTVHNAEDLRSQFFGAGPYPEEPITVLEVLVDLCIRYYRFEGEKYPGKYFMDIICDMGLVIYDDNHYVEDEVRFLIDMANTRAYDKNGIGGFFPVHAEYDHIKYDARTSDLWTQIKMRHFYDSDRG